MKSIVLTNQAQTTACARYSAQPNSPGTVCTGGRTLQIQKNSRSYLPFKTHELPIQLAQDCPLWAYEKTIPRDRASTSARVEEHLCRLGNSSHSHGQLCAAQYVLGTLAFGIVASSPEFFIAQQCLKACTEGRLA